MQMVFGLVFGLVFSATFGKRSVRIVDNVIPLSEFDHFGAAGLKLKAIN